MVIHESVIGFIAGLAIGTVTMSIASSFDADDYYLQGKKDFCNKLPHFKWHNDACWVKKELERVQIG